MAHYHLETQAILSLSGDQPSAFLQDILTADNASLQKGQMTQSCLLSPQGRIIHDMIILPESDDKLFLITEASQAEALMKKLMMYRLRRKITIESHSDLGVIASLDEGAPEGVLLTANDERGHHMGLLSLANKTTCDRIDLSDPSGYHVRRMANGIPSGAAELTPNRALMLEAGLDHLGAVDFKKGCYIGQEVTARTRWRGLVKRRIVPVTGTALIPGKDITLDGKSVGQILSCTTDPLKENDPMIGLASLKITAIHAAHDGQILLTEASAEPLKITVPAHLEPIPKPDEK